MNRFLSKYGFYYPATLLKGEMVFKFLSEYNKNQFRECNEIASLQLFYLKRLLLYAYQKCPFYQNLYRKNNIDLNLNSLDDLNCIPTITKQDIIEFQSTISADLCSLRLSPKTTGGSSGHPVTILKNVTALARERAATWRAYAWAGVYIGDPQARFWGVPLAQKNKIKYRIIDLIANRIRLSAFDISDLAMSSYYLQIKKFKPKYLYGYVSMIDVFGQYMQNNGLELPDSVLSIITTSEVLTDKIRDRIKSNLHRNIFNEYGCGEVGSIAHECSCGAMHIMADNLIVEVDESGELIVTDLHNYAMPLIRYRLNDFAKLSNEQCSCGCNFPILEKIYGRAYDLIHLAGGKKVHPEIVMYVFEEFKDRYDGLNQFQFVQHDIGKVSINLVVGKSFVASIYEKLLKNRLEEVLGEKLSVKFNYKEKIIRERSGKIRVVKCEMN